jgi:hypothetical protein
MDVMRAVIIGAKGTPYHDGLFFFDLYFPNKFPDVPPVCDLTILYYDITLTLVTLFISSLTNVTYFMAETLLPQSISFS